MLISTERGGGEIVSATDDTRFYDDVACLAADWANRSGDVGAYVHVGGGWSDAPPPPPPAAPGEAEKP